MPANFPQELFMDVQLVVAAGKAEGRVIPLPASIFVIGRDRQSHLRAHCPLVSRRHCAIAHWAGKVVVRDLRSANGTFINDERVRGEVRVKDGDVLRVGTLAFRFKISTNSLGTGRVRGSAVKWLLDSTQETKPAPADTHVGPMPTLVAESDEAAADSGDLSAGDFLHGLVRKPK
jgi:pSer/pThr/pTyr-binding forkhead associated (FHA) protein